MQKVERTKTRMTSNGLLVYWCPGCSEPHGIPVDAARAYRWAWNGDRERPTLSPSVLIQSGHYATGHVGPHCWCTYNRDHPDSPSTFVCRVCHSFVREGQIQYLNDCTHALAGKTVDLEAF